MEEYSKETFISERECEIKRLKELNRMLEAEKAALEYQSEKMREKRKIILQICICVVVSIICTLLCNFFFG